MGSKKEKTKITRERKLWKKINGRRFFSNKVALDCEDTSSIKAIKRLTLNTFYLNPKFQRKNSKKSIEEKNGHLKRKENQTSIVFLINIVG